MEIIPDLLMVSILEFGCIASMVCIVVSVRLVAAIAWILVEMIGMIRNGMACIVGIAIILSISVIKGPVIAVPLFAVVSIMFVWTI